MKNKLLRNIGFLFVACSTVFTLACTLETSSSQVTSSQPQQKENLVEQQPTDKPKIKSKNLAQNVLARRFTINENKLPNSNDNVAHAFDTTHWNSNVYLSALLFRKKAVGSPKFEVLPSDNTFGGVNLKVLEPSYEALKFENVEKIIVETPKGVYVFDSDDFDIFPPVRNDLMPVVDAYSSNPRSINSKFFFETMGEAKKISLVFKDVNWVDQKGHPTKYKVVPEDMLFSFLRTFYLIPEYRWANGGSGELDEYWYKQTKEAAKFSPTSRWANEYLLEIFQIDYKAIADFENNGPHAPIGKVQAEGKTYDAFSIYLKDNATPGAKQLLNFFKMNILDSGIFNLAPSQYIEEVNKIRETQLVDHHDGSGVIKRIGHYWYGEKFEDLLFAGPYYLAEYSKVGSSELTHYKKNPYYFDRDFVESPNTNREVIVKSQERSAEAYQQLLYSEFVQGIATRININLLDTDSLARIKSGQDPNIPKERIVFTKSFTFDQVLGHLRTVVTPKPTEEIQDYSYNDIYAKFMYGADRESLAKGEINSTKTFFGDDQISFRSLLLAAVNWEKSINTKSKGSQIFSLSLAAPFASLGGKDHETSEIKYWIDDFETANSPFTVVKGKRKTTVSYESNKKQLLNLSQSEGFFGGGLEVFAILQEDMTNLLDKVYKENNWSDQDKMEFTWIWRTRTQSEEYTLAWEGVLNVLNQLDKKKRLVITREILIDYDKAIKRIYRGFGTRIGTLGWSYDFDGNGTYLDYMLHRIEGAFYLSYFPQLLKKEETDPDNPFPLLTRLAKLLAKGIKEEVYHFKYPLEEWDTFVNKDIFTYNPFLHKEGYPSPEAEFTRFFSDVQNKFTNKEHILLNVELSVLMGPKFDTTATLYDPARGYELIKQDGISFPYPFKTLYNQDIVYEPLSQEEEGK